MYKKISALFLAIAVAIGGTAFADASAQETTTPTPLELKNQAGDTLESVTVGQLAVLSTTVVNNSPASKQFAAIVEVRDADNVTIFLQFQTGTVIENGQAEIGISWTPKEAGTYQLRTFLISGFQEPEVLSVVATSEAVVE